MPADRGGVSLEGRVRQIAHQFSSPDRSRSPIGNNHQPTALASVQTPSNSLVVSSPITPATKNLLPQTLIAGRSSERSARDKSPSLLSNIGASKGDDEKENLRKEKNKLAEALRRKELQHQRDLEELKALRESDVKLRQELDKTGGINIKASEPIVFQPRGIVKDGFSIHNWDKERQGFSIPIDGAGHLVIAGAGNASSEGALALVKPESSQLSASTAGEPNFAEQGVDEEEARVLHDAWRHLSLGDIDAAMTAMRDLLTMSTEDSRGYHACKYLSFSSSFALLLDHLRPPFSAPSQATTGIDDAAVRPLTDSVAVLDNLARGAQFGEEPPKGRPQEVSRLLYVRSLCAQIGLALDTARVGFIERQERQSQLATAIQVAVDQQGSPSRNRSRSRDVACPRTQFRVPKRELELLLKRAGTYLLAVQMDMDRLHDEAVDRIEEAKTKQAAIRREFDSATLASSNLAGEAQDSVADTVIDTLSEPSATQDLALTNGDDVSNPPASQAGALMSASDETVVAPDSEEAESARLLAEDVAGMEEEKPPPSFGDFLVKDLMPLYVKDVPFGNLRCLAEKYCGLSLDSDDEDRVLKSAGQSAGKPQARAPRRHAQRRLAADPEKKGGRATTDKRGESLVDAMATPEAAKALFSQQVHAVQKPISSGTKTRFLTSVVQKENKTGLSAIPASLVKQMRRSGSSRQAHAAAPIFINSPGPGSARKAALKGPAMSPVCMRGGVMSSTPQSVQRGSTRASWDGMDATPLHQRRG